LVPCEQPALAVSSQTPTSIGPGTDKCVTTAVSRNATLTTTEGAILTGAATLVMLAMAVIDGTSAARRERESSTLGRSLLLAIAMLTVGSIIGGFESPVLMVVAIAAVCGAQLTVALSGTFRIDQPMRLSAWEAVD
jgi:putative effector of murein hydrolase